MKRMLYFDCSCGASGDMIVGALIDAGAPFETIRNALDSLKIGHFHVTADKVAKHGISATQFRVHVDQEHHQAHRRLGDVLAIIERGALPDEVKSAAAETFRRIADCEAKIHGSTPAEVPFHEVGAVDSIADIVSAHYALHLLGIERVVSSPLNVGSGTVKVAHGVMAVPAPATAMLLEGVPSYGSEVPFELVTPTGAALITQRATEYGPMPPMRILATGYGSGTRELDDRANVLRAIVGEETDVSHRRHYHPVAQERDPTAVQGEVVTVIEFNVDDMNPELLPALIADVIERGARDAFFTPILGKKGRPGYLVTVLCDEPAAEEIGRALFEGTTTFGLRLRQERRICLEREWKQAATPWGPVRVKVGRYQGNVTSASPEFEDCRRVAVEAGVPLIRVYDAARAAAVKGELEDA
ncbi:MAG TPA: nickel pincer cofactor biosynthesis protein LarC [Candidatus Bathyarchaeia archaeon]|nr:nickel pincer cofactor biosynthesis protein LarC [Candidatus Bathyarchaeia archaeon]